MHIYIYTMKRVALSIFLRIILLSFVNILFVGMTRSEAPCGSTNVIFNDEKIKTHLKKPRDGWATGKITDALLKNVETLSIQKDPGFLTVYGESAESVLAGGFNSKKDVYHPIVAAGPLGKGRIVGCSHTSFLKVHNEEDNLGFILNMARWASSKPEAGFNFSVAILQDSQEESLVKFFQSREIPAQRISWASLSHVEDLVDFDVVLTSEFCPQSKVKVLEEFSRIRGGGLVMALTPGASSETRKYNEDETIHFGLTFPANQLAAAAGFVWRGASYLYAKPTTPSGHFNGSKEFVKNTHFLQVWEEIQKFVDGSGSKSILDNLLQFKTNFEQGIKSIPPVDEIFSSKYQDFKRFKDAIEKKQPIPTADHPIVNDTEKLLASLYHHVIKFAIQPDDILPHPASQFFPGKVDQSPTGKRESRIHRILINLPVNDMDSNPPLVFEPDNIFHGDFSTEPPIASEEMGMKNQVEINQRHSLWFTTGLYAPPGATIRIWSVSNPPAEIFIPLKVQIGCHTDDLSKLKNWKRLPQITMTFSTWTFRSEVSGGDLSLNLTVASPYGGLLYVILPPEVNTGDQPSLELFVEGAVRAPVFKLGQTSLKRWREEYRFYPGPWAEFESSKIIFTVPSSIARDVLDPESILHFWDLVMDGISDLLAIPRERVKQERIVADIQIVAGALHAGYPIMSQLEDAQVAVDLHTLRSKGSWGHFHELGHNHQRDAWTFSGTREVTNNLIVLYIQNTVLGIPTEKRQNMHPQAIKKRVSAYLESKLNFDLWKKDPWLALTFYYQLQLNYGWEAFKRVFSWYNEHVTRERESRMKDAEKIDLWLVTFSKAIGEDLSPFFKSWGIPFSAKASEQVKDLPAAPIRLIDMLNL